MFKETQTIYEYRLQSWDKIVRAIADAAAYGATNAPSAAADNTLWSLLSDINGLAEAETSSAGKFSLFPTERMVIGFLDSDLLAQFLTLLKTTERGLLGSAIAGADTARGRTVLPDERILAETVSDSFFQLGLEPEVAKRWLLNYHRLSDGRKNVIAKSVQTLTLWHEQLFHQALAVGAVLNIHPNTIQTYTLEELNDLYLGGKDKLNEWRLLRSLSDFIRMPEDADVVRIIAPYFTDEKFRDRESYHWDEALFLALLVDAAYEKFELLSDELQTLILRSYFYRAIVLGVPVRSALERTLYPTRTSLSYLNQTKFLSDALAVNLEYIPLSPAALGRGRLFGLVMEDCLASSPDAEIDAGKQQAFAQKFYSREAGAKPYQDWLAEAMSIYFHLRQADLIDHNRGGVLTAGELAFNDMVQLMAWFGIGVDGADEIVRYFTAEQPRVSLTAFLDTLVETADLTQPVAVENCVEVSKALHEAKLLPSDQDLIIFQEAEGTFAWNPALSKA